MKKIATMFLGLSLVIGSVPVFAADDAKDTTKATKAKKTRIASHAKVEGKKKGHSKAKKTTEEKK